MASERFEIAVRVLDAICECRDPCNEDAGALRRMAETAEEQFLPLNELACAIIDRERNRLSRKMFAVRGNRIGARL